MGRDWRLGIGLILVDNLFNQEHKSRKIVQYEVNKLMAVRNAVRMWGMFECVEILV